MLEHKNKFYQPANMVVGICGNIHEKKVLGLIKTYFGKRERIGVAERSDTATRQAAGSGVTDEETNKSLIMPGQRMSRVALKRKDTQQVQLCFGFPAYSYFHKNRYALELLNVILGGNMSSRLFIEVRERRGLCYFIRSNANSYQDIGSFIIQAGLDKNRINEAIPVITQEIKKMVQKGAGEKDLRQAKDYVQGRAILEFEDSHEIADFYASQLLLLDKVETLEQKLAKIEKVTVRDIGRVARDVLKIRNSTLALIGPFADKKRFLRILK